MNGYPYALIVDDDANLARLLACVLGSEEAPPRTHHVSCGKDALDFLLARGRYTQRSGPSPKVIFLDFEIGCEDGLQVLREIKAEQALKLIPVVMLAGAPSRDRLRQSYALGANAYVVKPADFREFSSSMRTLGSFWLSVNEVP